MGPRDTRQINWRATPPTADLLDLAILVRQTVDADPTFTIKKAAEEATRAWSLEQLRANPDIAARSSVALTIGAATATRDLDGLTQYLRDSGLDDIADTLDRFISATPARPQPGTAELGPAAITPNPAAEAKGPKR